MPYLVLSCSVFFLSHLVYQSINLISFPTCSFLFLSIQQHPCFYHSIILSTQKSAGIPAHLFLEYRPWPLKLRGLEVQTFHHTFRSDSLKCYQGSLKTQLFRMQRFKELSLSNWPSCCKTKQKQKNTREVRVKTTAHQKGHATKKITHHCHLYQYIASSP